MDELVQRHYARGWYRWPKQFRVLTWNIERGLRLPGVMDFIGSWQPDLCILQELDLNAKRTGKRDLADLIAAQFGFNCVFGVEFEELSQRSNTDRAFQGNAIFTRSAIRSPRILRFSRQSDAWNPHWFLPRWQVFQPRRGGRMALAAELACGWSRLAVYDLHLESKGDDRLRLSQLREVVDDSRRYPLETPVVIAGDLNTSYQPSPLRQYLLSAGFVDACQTDQCRRTKPDGRTLDWIFTRGPIHCSETTVHRGVRASDHYPVSTVLTLA